MAARWAIVVGLVAIGGGVAWLVVRRSGEASKTGSGPPSVASDHLEVGPTQRAPGVAPTTPALAAPTTPSLTVPALPKLPDGASPADQLFVTEIRDDDWAPATEAQITKRFERVRGAKLQDLECRHDQCRITVAGSEGEVDRTISDLESDRGLHGFAKNILLTAPDRAADGSLVMKLYASFDR